MELTEYYGRLVLVPRDQPRPAGIDELAAMEVNALTVRCCRCGQVTSHQDAALPNGEFYCPACINLGRVSTLCKFYHVPEANQFKATTPVLTWKGKLSPLQDSAARRIKMGMEKHQRQLLWAVTGAGKTEMIFQGLAACLARGERIAVASPRVDVCLELYPRLQAAFENTPIALLHGRSNQPYHYTQLTICTTHQLLRFYHAFDNLIIDEVDAFPYAADPQLFYASQRAVKENGGQLFLTATPGKQLLAEVRHHQLAVTYLPLRYHGHLLPSIHLHIAMNWRKRLKRKCLPAGLVQAMKAALAAGHRFLLFVPHVKDLTSVAAACAGPFANYRYGTVHASDPERLTKVQMMRNHQYHFLITTSILERGVTFPEIDVFVLGADDEVFSTAALVQIAGRAGRSASRPDGQVAFWLASHCRRVSRAVSQIRYMNNKGRRCQMSCLLCNRPLRQRLTIKQLLWPSKVVLSVICDECRQTFARITGNKCPVCYRPQRGMTICRDCQQWRQAYSWRLKHQSLYRYNDAMKDFMHRYKFMGDYRLRSVFSNELVAAIKATSADLVVPIPVTAQTMATRGFNQVVAMLEGTHLDNCLRAKERAKLAQSSKSRQARLLSKQPFMLEKPSIIKGKRVLIIDDVYTTGRTLYHAAELMYSTGAVSVVSISLAR